MVNSAQAAGSLWILEDLDSFFFFKEKKFSKQYLMNGSVLSFLLVEK